MLGYVPCSKLITESDEVSCDRKDSVEQTETKQEDHAQEDVTKLSNLNAKYVLDI